MIFTHLKLKKNPKKQLENYQNAATVELKRGADFAPLSREADDKHGNTSKLLDTT